MIAPLSPPPIKLADEFKGVLIGVPAYGQSIVMQSHSMIVATMYALGRIGVRAQEYSLSMAGSIAHVRNLFLTTFYDNYPEYSHLLLIDNDMVFDPALIFRMLKLDKPMTGVFYRRREENPRDGNIMSVVIGHELEGESEYVDGFLKCMHFGGGVMLIKRDVITQMIKRFPQISDTRDPGRLPGVTRIIRAFDEMTGPDGNELSEDYSFCERWRQCGGELWANIDHVIGHVGPYNYQLRYLDLIQDRLKKPEAETLLDLAAA